VDLLGRRLLAELKSPALRAAVHAAWRRTLRFFDGLYVDLHHLAGNLAKTAGQGGVADACFEIQQVIDGQESRSPVIAEGHVGQRMRAARGLSIYFPTHWNPSVRYRELDFAKRTVWAEFLEAHLGADRINESPPGR
jgi:hypothetical protein